jgi:hypothetical protein
MLGGRHRKVRICLSLQALGSKASDFGFHSVFFSMKMRRSRSLMTVGHWPIPGWPRRAQDDVAARSDVSIGRRVASASAPKRSRKADSFSPSEIDCTLSINKLSITLSATQEADARTLRVIWHNSACFLDGRNRLALTASWQWQNARLAHLPPSSTTIEDCSSKTNGEIDEPSVECGGGNVLYAVETHGHLRRHYEELLQVLFYAGPGPRRRRHR